MALADEPIAKRDTADDKPCLCKTCYIVKWGGATVFCCPNGRYHAEQCEHRPPPTPRVA